MAKKRKKYLTGKEVLKAWDAAIKQFQAAGGFSNPDVQVDVARGHLHDFIGAICSLRKEKINRRSSR